MAALSYKKMLFRGFNNPKPVIFLASLT